MRENTKQLLEELDYFNSLKNLVRTVLEQELSSIVNGPGGSEMLDIVIGAVFKMVNEEETLKEFSSLYEKTYTSEEIDQLLEFYRSPLGKKTIAVAPVVGAAMNEWMKKQIEGKSEDVKKIITDYILN